MIVDNVLLVGLRAVRYRQSCITDARGLWSYQAVGTQYDAKSAERNLARRYSGAANPVAILRCLQTAGSRVIRTFIR